jgi:hypothetical protein
MARVLGPAWPAIAGCMALAAALRFVGLASQSLWIDEIYSAEMIRWPLDVILRVQDGHPPLFALLHLAVAGFVDSDLAGRLIAATAGVLAVGLLAQLASETWDTRTGWVAGVLLAVSPLHVWYSQEGRSYALVVLIAVGSSLAMIRGVRDRRPTAWVAVALLSLAGLLTHYLYAAMMLAQGLFLLLDRAPGRAFTALVGVALIGAVCLPVLGPEATRFVGDQRSFEWLALPYVGFTMIGGFGLGPPVEALHRDRSLAVVLESWPGVAVVALVAAGVVLAWPRAQAHAGRFGRYVVLWAVVPVGFAFFGSWLRDGAFNVRYAIAALPAVVLGLAIVVTAGSTRRLAIGLAVLVGLSALSIQRERSDPRYLREDYRGAAAYLAAHAAPSDRVVVSARYAAQGVAHYYTGPVTIEPLPVRQVGSSDDAAASVRALTPDAGDRATWLVLVREWEDDPRGHLEATLAARAVAPAARLAGIRIFRLIPASS